MDTIVAGTHGCTVDGTRQVYHVAGRGPVLIAHSGGPGVDHAYLRSAALEEHFTVVYLEPVGTGDSQPLPAGATYLQTYTDFLYAVVEHLAVPRVFLLGHSHGGVVAQRFAVQHPGRIAGLALYSSTPVTGQEFWTAAADEAARHPERHPDVPEAVEAAAALSGSDLRALLPVYFADYWGRRHEFQSLRDTLRTWPVEFSDRTVDLRPELPLITAPTVVISGRHDFICGPAWADMLHQGIAGSRLVTLENSGHFGQIEEPAAFLDAVVSLLSDTSFPDRIRAAFRRGDTAAVTRMAAAERDRGPSFEVEALYALSRVALRDGDLARAEEVAGQALEIAVGTGERSLEERPRHVLAAVARLSGDHPLARDRYLASIALNESLGNTEQVNAEYHNLAFTELHLGNLDRARQLFAEGRERVHRLGWTSFVPYLGVAAAALATADRDHPRAARMIGFTDHAYAALGQVPDPDDAADLARSRDAALAALGEPRYTEEYRAGTTLPEIP
ncbi:alpha/beta fold hydrolase [Actinoplanes couchii]|uniref:AB hydrolase-1 domain-containing protein n=1 Tax=Actinoplanes couchii TaxID=403638 RepID=A0ABQ3XNU8_9ACTN|nr:alpha/beta fold hydrolase [Actinoplanes couchii]MDR6319601.1 pimeloyl-ACP methyl ester carboxylesterase [Actinoplanes couchii]GID60176.1 hypothetical protein Aco03nite_085800 [Actinoplanes couchii]